MSTLLMYKKYPYKGKIPKYCGLVGRTKVNNGTAVVGIELEVEGINSSVIIPPTFRCVPDLSLKLSGSEFVTIPIQLKYLEIELTRLIIKKYTMSKRCSLHVHLNIRDMTEDQFKSLICLYLLYEKTFFRLSGGRDTNIYCVPLLDDIAGTAKFINSSVKNSKGSKYAALNVAPAIGGAGSDLLGTIEFRHHVGTLDTQVILNWCSFITTLKKAASTMDFETTKAHIRMLSITKGYKRLTRAIFGTLANQIIKHPDFIGEIEDSLLKTKVCIL